MPFDAHSPAAWPAARPLVKWTGGKTAELDAIRRALPTGIGRHLEPFVGGGAVLWAMPPDVAAEANDRSADLVALYRCQQTLDPAFLAAAAAIEAAWTGLDGADTGLADEPLAARVAAAAAPLGGLLGPRFPQTAAAEARRAIARKRRFLGGLVDQGKEVGDTAGLLLAALKGGLYTALRAEYNAAAAGPGRAALFWFLREFCYGGMFRTNAAGGCNVPYGGISYNRRSLAARLAQLRAPETRARLAAARFHCGDFAAFFDAVRPETGDFVFLDPPYDSPFSTYDGNAFTRADHRRLAETMAAMTARWMLVISETDFVRACYGALPGARVTSFDKLYQGSIKERFDRRAVHLLITNYDWDGAAV